MPEGEPLARARRVGVPTSEALDAPTLDAALTAVTTPTRPRDDLPLARRRRPPPPAGPEPFALTGLVFGIVAVALGCLWPISAPAALVALACGVVGLNGRSRRSAVAAVTLGAVGLAAGLGVAASSVALIAQKSATPPTTAPPPVWVPPVPKGPVPFLLLD